MSKRDDLIGKLGWLANDVMADRNSDSALVAQTLVTLQGVLVSGTHTEFADLLGDFTEAQVARITEGTINLQKQIRDLESGELK